MEMKYSLGCNFDPELIDFIKETDTKHQIESLFGKLKRDIVGGGRASNVLPDLSIKELKQYIDKCNQAGLHFNYLLNPMCLGNRELMPSEHKKMMKFIDNLCNMGIYSVTVNSPFLCELLKRKFPQLKVTIGLYAYIYSLQHVRYWDDLGADEITLHHRVNRNFEELRRMLTYTKRGNMKLRLIANNICIHDCPYQINHGCGQAHASQKEDQKKGIYLDYNLLKCNYAKVKNSHTLIASEWIRPEDIHYYSELCDEVGNNNFSIKLLERTKTTQFLKGVVSSYLNEQHDGNLIDILTWASSRNTKVVDKKQVYKNAVLGHYNIADLKKYEEVFKLPNIVINNNALDGFLEKFRNNYRCDKLVCGDDCSYCSEWANKSVSFNQMEQTEWLKNTDEVLSSMKNSRIFIK